ncbi:MAG: hypothetical protein KIG15_03010 [Coriobacteriales bacterium]|nr:hypothetical protein [Coriobacteriales bacterium]
MYYNPMMNILLRILGEAAAQSLGGRPGQGGGPSPFSQAPQDDSPIDVEAQVVDEDGKTEEERRREAWRQEQRDKAARQLQGEVSFLGSKTYILITGILTLVLLLAGVALRVYSLVMGNIFSMTVVPVVLGVLAALVMMLVASLLMWRRGVDRVPFCEVDLVMVFFSAALMGWGNLLPALGAAAIGWGYMAASKSKRLPFFVPFIVIASLQFFLLGFPGLIKLF